MMKPNIKCVITTFSIVFLLCIINAGFSTTRIFPNGTTIIDSRGNLRFSTKSSEANIELEDFQFNANHVTALHGKDFHVSAAGNNFVLEASELQFMCSLDTANITTASKNLRLVHGIGGFVEIDNLKFGGNVLNSKSGNIVVAPSDFVEMRTTKIIGDPLSGDYFNLTSKSSHLKLGTENEGDILLDAGENHSVRIVASRLDLLGAALNLTGTHVTLDQIISQSLLINGTLITTTDSDVDIILSPQGSGFVRVGSGKTFDVSSATLLLRDDQISGDKVEGGVINAIQINTLSTNTLTSSGSTVSLAAGKTFDVSSGVLQLADNQISGDKISGGTIDAVAITTLSSGEVTVDNVKIDSNTVQAVSGDLNLQCGVGSRVKIGDTLQIGKLVMSGNTLNTSEAYADLILSPYGLGAVKVAEGKTLDLRGVTLMIDDDAIKRMDNVTINELVGHLIKSGMLTISGETISSSGDIRFSPAAGKKVEVTQSLIVEKLKLDYNSISTTTGQPVTINNLTCPVATVGSVQIEDNEVSCIGATCDIELSAAGTGDVVLKSDVLLGAGKSITGTTSGATFQTVKTSTVSTTSGDLTLNPAGQNVKISASKTLDVTGATLKLDDDSISGDKIEGGTVGNIEVKNLRSGEVSVSGRVQVNGSVESVGGVRDSHAWSTNEVASARLRMGRSSGNTLFEKPLLHNDFSSFNTESITGAFDSNLGYSDAVSDGRYVYYSPHHLAYNRVLRFDTEGDFHSSDSYTYYELPSTIDGHITHQEYTAAAFDSKYVYMIAYANSAGQSGIIVRYNTRLAFNDPSSWSAYNANGTGGLGTCGWRTATYGADGYLYLSGNYDGVVDRGYVMRFNTRKEFKDASSWEVYNHGNHGSSSLIHTGRFLFILSGQDCGDSVRYDASLPFLNDSSWTSFNPTSKTGCNMVNAGSDGRFVYTALNHGYNAIRLDTLSSFTDLGSWQVRDVRGTSGLDSWSYMSTIFTGRYIMFAPYAKAGHTPSGYHGIVLQFDTQGDFHSADSWQAVDAINTGGWTCRLYTNPVFTGRYVLFTPALRISNNGHGVILRYDSGSPEKRPSLAQIASNKDLFISSNSNVGIGTTSPTTKLDIDGSVKVSEKIGIGISTPNNPSTELEVKGTARIDKVEIQESLSVGANTTEMGNGEAVRVEGGVMAKGGVRDSHAWSSESARRAKLALALNSGGYGSSTFTGGPMNASFFEGFDASGIGPGNVKGFSGAVFDGRYVYFVPMYDSVGYSGKVLRYDSQQSFTSSTSWRVYDASSVGPGSMVGFQGGVFDGQYVYFVPYRTSEATYSGRVLRYDTRQPFESSSSWNGFDASSIFPSVGNLVGYVGGVFDGRFLYFIPHFDGSVYHCRVLRFDSLKNFTSKESWDGYDASNVSPGHMHGYAGAVFDGQFIYFVPHYCDGAYHGHVLRFDTGKPFGSIDSWKGYDASATSPGNMKGYWGGVYDGRYVYFSPYENPSEYSGRVLRYDTAQSFTSSSAWSGYDASGSGIGNMRGYRGVLFDGRYLLFIPFLSGAYHGRIMRYDSHGSFDDPESWSGFDASSTSPGNMIGFVGGVFDGRYCYFAPTFDGSQHGRVLRFDTRSPQPRPSLTQIATSSELFIASNGSVGIGTTNVGSEKLTVEGGVVAKGGVRDSHAWGSESARRAKLALALNSGGFGSSVFTGGPMNASFFEGFDASSTSPGNMKGFIGAVFDGRYVYFVPSNDGSSSYHGRVLRYDSQQSFTSSASWSGYDATNTSPGNMKGYRGAVFDGRYVYFVPNYDGSYHGRVLRYDSQQSFTLSTSWSGYDAANTSPGNMKGFHGTVFDGRYVYFVPHNDGSSYHGRVLRYDSQQSFTSAISWTGYDASATSPGNMKGFAGAVFDGRYVYFVPYYDGSSYHGRVLRFDSQGSFTSSSSWSGYDASGTSPGNMKGFRGLVFDGRYVYFVPSNDGSSPSGKVLRYDSKQSFTLSTSWSGYDAASTSPGIMKGFMGAVFDGRYVYFVPYSDGSGSGRVLRYDSQLSFTSSASWSGFDAASTSPGNMKGFIGAVFDGRYVYFVPYYDGSSYHGRVLRFDSRSPEKRPSIQQMATSSELFIASNGSVGIGTTNPGSEKLTVEGGVVAKGGVRDSHAWGSESARRAKLALALNNGGVVVEETVMSNNSDVEIKDLSSIFTSISGFDGSVFDGRYVYFSPLNALPSGLSGLFVRYDTQQMFGSTGGWESYNAAGTNGHSCKGYGGGTFDGRYVYFSPQGQAAVLENSVVLRFDTHAKFADSGSWTAYDAFNTSGLHTVGFSDAIFDGHYVYFVPYQSDSPITAHHTHGNVLRYSVSSEFTSPSSWVAVNLATLKSSYAIGYSGGCFDGRYLYMAQHTHINDFGANMVQYDSSLDFLDASSWIVKDAQYIGGMTNRGYEGCVFDGRSVYFIPRYGGALGLHSHVLKYDTAGQGFSDSASWSVYDASGSSSMMTLGFYSGGFDGRYVHFFSKGRIIRYDTRKSFSHFQSWTAIQTSWGTGGGLSRLSIFDGRYLYASSYQHILRYDSRSPQPRPSIQQIASNEDLFIASDGKVSTGTTSPTAKLDVVYSGVAAGETVLKVSGVNSVGGTAEYNLLSVGHAGVFDKFVVRANGKVGIGTSNPSEALTVVGTVYTSAVTAVGTITGNIVTATSTCCSSDIRLKSNITTLTNSLSTIKQLRGIRYNWKKNGEPSIGFVAQELEEVVPEVVVTGSDGYKAVDYGKLSAVLVSGIQEMQSEMEELSSRLEKLEKLIL